MDNADTLILHIALDTPLRRVFDYKSPADVLPLRPRAACSPRAELQPGIRVRVPFGRRELIGVLVGTARASTLDPTKLKTALEVLDEQPVFDPVTWELVKWAADYYHHGIGEVIAAALPASLREGQVADDAIATWSLTPAGREELTAPTDRRAPRQRALLAWLGTLTDATGTGSAGRSIAEDIDAAFTPELLRAVCKRGWVALSQARPVVTAVQWQPGNVTLTTEQVRAVELICASIGHFAAHLLYGVTGSGKTEVYLRVIAAAIAQGGQALLLVPEIALTPQLVERFRSRFSTGIAVLHSALSNSSRRDAWRAAHSGRARIVIGTRSAVFTSMPKLALLVVDEEHDASYKQQEGFRYSARDLAVWRAQRAQIPIILGSATPSLETLENVAQGRYSKFLLPQRPGAAQAPRMSLVDMRQHASEQGLSQPALSAIKRHLGDGGQVIIFLNRRGYAPALFCNACGWAAPCAHCDARMTLHRRAAQLRCHHCGAVAPLPPACGQCGQTLQPVGQGTERVEDTLSRLFPDTPLARLDRDTVAGSGAMEALLDRVHSGAARILIGTQMLTKGHHFPDVSLVVIVDADQGLFASDYRATERLAQTITQVAGRAGRAARAGEVLIQTAYPDHPLLTRLICEGYDGFAASALEERRQAQWPPFSRLAMLRAEARDRAGLDEFLTLAADAGHALHEPAVNILGPASALMARRADYFRAHLLIETATRPKLQRFLSNWLPQVERLPGLAKLRWSIDVDPLEVD